MSPVCAGGRLSGGQGAHPGAPWSSARVLPGQGRRRGVAPVQDLLETSSRRTPLHSVPSPVRVASLLPIAAALALPLPWIVVWTTGQHPAPLVVALLAGLAI